MARKHFCGALSRITGGLFLLLSTVSTAHAVGQVQGKTFDRESGAGVATTVFLFGYSSTTTGPPNYTYSFNNLTAPQNYTLSANTVPGYQNAIEVSVCTNATGACHTESSFVNAPNGIVTVTVPNGGYVDVWWRFTLETTHIYDFDDEPFPKTYTQAFEPSNFSGGAEVTMTNPRSAPKAALIYGTDNSEIDSLGYYRVANNVNIPITADTWLEYYVEPRWAGGSNVAVDLKLDDGTFLRESMAVDQRGTAMHPFAQGRSGKLVMNTYTRVLSHIGDVLAGRTITQVLIGYDSPPRTGWTVAAVDDIKISERVPVELTYDFDSVAPYQDLVYEQSGVSSTVAERTPTSARSLPYAMLTLENHNSGPSYVYYKVFDTDLLISGNSWLEYYVMPTFGVGAYSAVDLVLDDGTRLRVSRSRRQQVAQTLGAR